MEKPKYRRENLPQIKPKVPIDVYRLIKEHLSLYELELANSGLIKIAVKKKDARFPNPPKKYEITYKVRSIIGIKEDHSPIYGDSHQMELVIPNDYPLQSAACKMLSKVWHPNIKYDGVGVGTICSSSPEFGTLFHLDELVVRIGEMLQYKRYHALFIEPWPEDTEVAKWVTAYGEPNDIANKATKISVDSREWKAFTEEAPQEEALGITFFEKEEEEEDPVQEEDSNDITFL